MQGRTLRIILETPQLAALLCSALALLDPDGIGNAQDFAASAGWMMPRRLSASLIDVQKGIPDDSTDESQSEGEGEGQEKVACCTPAADTESLETTEASLTTSLEAEHKQETEAVEDKDKEASQATVAAEEGDYSSAEASQATVAAEEGDYSSAEARTLAGHAPHSPFAPVTEEEDHTHYTPSPVAPPNDLELEAMPSADTEPSPSQPRETSPEAMPSADTEPSPSPSQPRETSPEAAVTHRAGRLSIPHTGGEQHEHKVKDKGVGDMETAVPLTQLEINSLEAAVASGAGRLSSVRHHIRDREIEAHGHDELATEPAPAPAAAAADNASVPTSASETTNGSAPDLASKLCKDSPRSRRRQSSCSSLQSIWAKLLPGVMSNGSTAQSVRASGILYVLAERPDNTETDRNAQFEAPPSPRPLARKMNRRHSSSTLTVSGKFLPDLSQTDASGNAVESDAAPQLKDGLEWQPRIYEVSDAGVLRIQCGGLSSDDFMDCPVAELDVTLEAEGCAQLAVPSRRRRRTSAECKPRYAGVTANHVLVKSAFANRPPEEAFVMSSSQATSRSPFSSAPATDGGLRKRGVRFEEAGMTEAAPTPRARTKSLNIFELGIVSASQVTRQLAPPPAKEETPQSPGRESKMSREPKEPQEPQDFHDVTSKFLKTPVLKLRFPAGNAVLVTFVSARTRYSDTMLDERVPLTYGKYVHTHLTAVQEATTFADALQGQGQSDSGAVQTHLLATQHTLSQQCREVAAEHRRYTIVFNGSMAGSVGQVHVLTWCIIMLYTTLRPTVMRVFIFTLGTAMFISAERWLQSEGGMSFLKEIRSSMRRLRVASGDHV